MVGITAGGKGRRRPGASRPGFSAACGIGRDRGCLVWNGLLQSRGQVSNSPQESREIVIPPPTAGPAKLKLTARIFLLVPTASLAAMAVHWCTSTSQSAVEINSYRVFLELVLVASIAAAIIQKFWFRLRSWLLDMSPIIAAVLLLLAFWELIT